jgi:hypothetical protein
MDIQECRKISEKQRQHELGIVVLRGVLQVNFVCILMLNKEFQRPKRRSDDDTKIGLRRMVGGMGL